MDDLKRNAEHYWDPTAYLGIRNYIKSEEKRMEIFEGDILRASMNNGVEREFVVLSVHEKFSTVLMLSEDESLPYAVKCGCMKYTNPGMLSYVFNNNFTNLIRSMKKDELEDIMQEVIDSLGYAAPKTPAHEPKAIVSESDQDDSKDALLAQASLELTKIQAERDVYKNLYENLIGSMISK